MRKFLLVALKILVSGALLYLALRGVNLKAILARVNQISFGWIAFAIAVTLLQILLGALRWREITALCNAPLSAAQSLRFNLIGSFFNQTLPSSIGGDAVRLWLVSRTGAGWRAATYSVLVDRAIGLIALAILIVGSLPWSYQLISDAHGRAALSLIDFAALAGGLGFLAFGRLPWTWLTQWLPTKHIHACAVIANKVLFSRRTGPIVAVLSMIIHVLTAVIAWGVVRSIAAPATFTQVLLLIPPIILITMLPISIAGWGVREATMMVAFGYAGLPPEDGLVVSLLYGAVSFAVGAFGGLVWILSAEKAAKGGATMELQEQ
ncbi:flippase-like domain-containing protein [Bradyrhizobium sp. U87765 SZCCT0131]|uniref:lysylphosphatidylglycerol synthase transmembrane domain-containing protein n=1 Tax=unclassified Bradyrhizobium TaxID=2631580 RepID=UPI001BA86201|nr:MULTISPECIES: lysylphosphatidylglycerol synthase transmembrane domain-containing protein [unclassified Bradyrhizobium]MBR1219688.1 flippase-like domain-containing protein [Bradyrhizobium sp. U87765 SZCCT0131]MBR1262339.1 flippase-like domain-containing protein [Bradyrhizobium sp. U87765 SZCCT0134]MBR1308478.1 flippase-like domain-containing protein [Bradyrhizobium sp. U87765 SZCCT0110]MBR1318121.1 flippase-like domain-containing protein [Bradyrhizobium sp. U87765 SZCCT0109]MBR1351824.1 flip